MRCIDGETIFFQTLVSTVIKAYRPQQKDPEMRRINTWILVAFQNTHNQTYRVVKTFLILISNCIQVHREINRRSPAPASRRPSLSSLLSSLGGGSMATQLQVYGSLPLLPPSPPWGAGAWPHSYRYIVWLI